MGFERSPGIVALYFGFFTLPSLLGMTTIVRFSLSSSVLLDLCFDSDADSGLKLLAQLRTSHPNLPVLVFTDKFDFANRVKVARLGGQIFLHKPALPASVLAAVTQVLQHSNIVTAKILVVDDDPQILDILRTFLEPWGFKLTLLDNP